MIDNQDKKSDFKLETTHHSILWRPFDIHGCVNYDELKSKNEKIYFNSTTIDEFPEATVDTEGQLLFSTTGKIYPNKGNVHITGQYEIHEPVYGNVYNKYEYREYIAGTVLCEDIIKTRKVLIGNASEKEYGGYCRRSNYGGNNVTYEKTWEIISHKKKLEKSFKSMSVNFNCNIREDKYLFDEANIKTIKSIRVNSPHDNHLQISLICNGYYMTINSNQTYMFDDLVHKMAFLKFATMHKYYSDALWTCRLEECYLKIDNWNTQYQEAAFFVDIVSVTPLTLEGIPIYSY